MSAAKIGVYFQQGNDYIVAKDYLQALKCADAVLNLAKDNLDAIYMRAACLMNLGRLQEAERDALRLIKLAPDYVGAYVVLAHIYNKLQRFVSQKKILKKALQYLPRQNKLSSEVYSLLGSANVLLCNDEAAAKYFYQASCQENDSKLAVIEYSNYLMASNYAADISQQELYQRHIGYNKFFTKLSRYEHEFRWRDKIRIGYLSSDFKYHAVAYFAWCLIKNASFKDFEIICYADIEAPDNITKQFLQQPICWRNIAGKSDAEVAGMIYREGIDILVDLGGHTAHNRLSVLAYKPAPLQICGIGYFHSTGLQDVDYFISDSYCDPIGSNEQFFTERILRLPHTHWCYQIIKAMPECLAEPPCYNNNYVTFCSFNNFNKVSDSVLRAWKKILERIKNAKLILKSKLFDSKEGVAFARQRFIRLGLDSCRIEIRGLSDNYLNEYNEADIALDTFPYPGGATTCEALYMGVPVIVMSGRRHGSNFGVSILENIGCKDLIAESLERYINIAVDLAADLPRIKKYRISLRNDMEKSPLMSAGDYMRHLETAYKSIFKKWQQENLIKTGSETEELIRTGCYTAALAKCLDIMQYIDCYGDARQKSLIWARIAEVSLILGDGKASFQAYCQAFRFSGEIDRQLYENMLLSLHYERFERTKAAQLHKNFQQLRPLRDIFPPRAFVNRGKLRVGYISSDFRRHVMLNFIRPFIQAFDSEMFTIFCYMTVDEDEYTKNGVENGVVWRRLDLQQPEKAAETIYCDNLDLLVDFNGHSNASNMDILACRPAPIQISGLGYVDMLGLSYIDYVLADNTVSNDTDEALFHDKALLLNNLFCYQPFQTAAINEMAAFQRNGQITFGSFNNLAKVTDEVLTVWGKIIQGVQGSRLLLKCNAFADEAFCRQYKLKLKKIGINQCELRPTSSNYLHEYNDIDIALDPFPYNGGGTTCDALYMGVPVVTLRGDYFSANYGASVLTAAGLENLIAPDINSYIGLAVNLADNTDILVVLHKNLRTVLKKSALMNKAAYMQDVEQKYMEIVRARCEGRICIE